MNTSNEQLQEKKLHLENELKKLNIELGEVVNLNDSLVLENKEKVISPVPDIKIKLTYTKRMTILVEKNTSW